MPLIVTPITDPVGESSVTPALYPVAPIPVLSVNEQVPVLEYVDDQVPVLGSSSLREVAGSPVRDDSQSYLESPPGSVSGPIPSLISLSLPTDDVSRTQSGLAPMDQ